MISRVERWENTRIHCKAFSVRRFDNRHNQVGTNEEWKIRISPSSLVKKSLCEARIYSRIVSELKNQDLFCVSIVSVGCRTTNLLDPKMVFLVFYRD